MQRCAWLLVVLGVFLAAGNIRCVAEEFRPYSGSKLDENASREASLAARGKQSEVYTTDDAFDKVYAFYKGLYKEVTMLSSPKLPSGQQLKWAFFTIDGGKDLANSKYWM